jgi:hypothetical protein
MDPGELGQMRVTKREVDVLLKKCETNLRQTEQIYRRLQALIQSMDDESPRTRDGRIATKGAVKRKPPK